MMMMSSISRPHEFTSSQRKELELQMLIFNYIVSGNPIPSHLVLLFRRSLLLMDPFSLYPPGVSFDRKVEEDPEPWRCRRTDGKKWRCSKEASQESKYCERHMHRGKKCSRKHVEILPPTSAAAAAAAAAAAGATPYFHPPPPPLPLQLYPYSSAYKPPLGLSFDDDDDDTAACFQHANGLQEHNFFSKEEDRFDRDKGARHCFVMGADLKLEKPAATRAVERKEEGAQKPNYLYLFNERIESKAGSWMDSEEACAKTQLSISIP